MRDELSTFSSAHCPETPTKMLDFCVIAFSRFAWNVRRTLLPCVLRPGKCADEAYDNRCSNKGIYIPDEATR
jgi:hypothetical protein